MPGRARPARAQRPSSAPARRRPARPPEALVPAPALPEPAAWPRPGSARGSSRTWPAAPATAPTRRCPSRRQAARRARGNRSGAASARARSGSPRRPAPRPGTRRARAGRRARARGRPALSCADHILGLEIVSFGEKRKDIGFTVGDGHQTDLRRSDADALTQGGEPFMTFFVDNRTPLGALGRLLGHRTRPNLLVEHTQWQSLRRGTRVECITRPRCPLPIGPSPRLPGDGCS